MTVSKHDNSLFLVPTPVVYFVSILCAVWGAYVFCGKIIPYGPNGSTIRVLILVTSLIIWTFIPIFGCYISYRVWRGKLFPRSGRTRALSLYFVRLIVILFLFLIPYLVFTNLEWVSSFERLHYAFLGLYMISLQGTVSAAFAITKPDISKAVKNFLRCKCNAEPPNATSSSTGSSIRRQFFQQSASSSSMRSEFQVSPHEGGRAGLMRRISSLLSLFTHNTDCVGEIDESERQRQLDHDSGGEGDADEEVDEETVGCLRRRSDGRNAMPSGWDMEDEWQDDIGNISREAERSDGLSLDDTSSHSGDCSANDETGAETTVADADCEALCSSTISEPIESTTENEMHAHSAAVVRFSLSTQFEN